MLTRRDLLKLAGVAGASAALPAPAAAGDAAAAISASQAAAAAVAREPLQALTAAEADLLDAIVARLIPSDANGPGAREAQAVRYIDRALAGALSGSREAYRSGPGGARSVCAVVSRGAVHGAVAHRSGLGAHRRRNRRGDRIRRGIRRQFGGVLRTRARPTRCRARSAIRSTAATPTSSAGICSAIQAFAPPSPPTNSALASPSRRRTSPPTTTRCSSRPRCAAPMARDPHRGD